MSTEQRAVWKFRLKVDGHIRVLRAPSGSEPLCVHEQHEEPWLWMLVDPGAPLTDHGVQVVGTGWFFEPGEARYMGTCFCGDLVWHVFYHGQSSPPEAP